MGTVYRFMARFFGRLSLAEKISQVQKSIGGVGRHGENKLDHYDFQRWRDIAGELRGELARFGVIILPQGAKIVDEKSVQVQTVEGEWIPGARITIERRYEFTDGRETLVTHGMGAGEDHRDKAFQKADTAALKYLLRDMFLIPDIEDDPDEAAAHIEADLAPERKQVISIADRVQQARVENAKQHQDVSVKAVRMWNELCKNHGKTVAQRRAWLFANYGVKSITELDSKEKYDKAILWASSREEVAETLRTSVEATKLPPHIVAALDHERDLTGD